MGEIGLSEADVASIVSGEGQRLLSETTALRDLARQQNDVAGARYYEERRGLIASVLQQL